MADSLRLKVKKELTTWLEGITPENGYQHDLSPVGDVVRVYRGRMLLGENDPLPCLSIFEPPTADDTFEMAGEGRSIISDYLLLVQGWAAAQVDEKHVTDPADLLLADVQKRIAELIGNDLAPHEAKAHHNLFGLASKVVVQPGVARPPDQFSSLAYCYLRVAFTLAERVDDPYGV